ncbi:MAG: hypothetical protein C4542_08040 [Dehalococcoidia bacterium]|nr:MAG: hypothetical protein C4542_08040 [Dehalococcoidia bacterium]
MPYKRMNRKSFLGLCIAAPLAAIGIKALPKKPHLNLDEKTVWVDCRCAKGRGDGTPSNPYATIGEAVESFGGPATGTVVLTAEGLYAL